MARAHKRRKEKTDKEEKGREKDMRRHAKEEAIAPPMIFEVSPEWFIRYGRSAADRLRAGMYLRMIEEVTIADQAVRTFLFSGCYGEQSYYSH
jgi:capsid portal protein